MASPAVISGGRRVGSTAGLVVFTVGLLGAALLVALPFEERVTFSDSFTRSGPRSVTIEVNCGSPLRGGPDAVVGVVVAGELGVAGCWQQLPDRSALIWPIKSAVVGPERKEHRDGPSHVW